MSVVEHDKGQKESQITIGVLRITVTYIPSSTFILAITLLHHTYHVTERYASLSFVEL